MRKQRKLLALLALLGVLPVLQARDARADWQRLGTRWAVAREPGGAIAEIDDLTYPGLLGRAVIGHIAPIKPTPKPGALRAPDWWQSVPWKTRVAREPESFALADIDFARATRHPERLAQLLGRWNEELRPGFLEHFRFARVSDGGYDIQWDGLGDPPGGPALQVVTLRTLKSNLWRTLAHQVLEGLLTDVTGLITIPVVSALLNTAVDRFFHWEDLMTSTRQDALAEMLANPPEDFALSAGERERAAEGLLYAETSLIASPSWLWLRPRKQWASRRAAENLGSVNSRAWLAKAGIYTQPMSPDFDWEPPLGDFYLSGAGLPWGHPKAGPAIGLDSGHPDGIFLRRIGIEAATTAVIFASAWIPYVGGLEVDGFKALVEAPEDLLRRWEARLSVRLEDRESSLGENWEPELDHLIFQQENPFEISRAQQLVIVAERLKRLGL